MKRGTKVFPVFLVYDILVTWHTRINLFLEIKIPLSIPCFVRDTTSDKVILFQLLQ